MSSEAEAARLESNSGAAVGVPVDDIANTYDERRLNQLSDDALVASVADVVALPREEQADSFILHAPLELIARKRLLPFVQPSARKLARLHILAIAANYEAFGKPVIPLIGDDQPARDRFAENGRNDGGVSADMLIRELVAAIDGGDLQTVDLLARMLEELSAATRISPRLLIETLAPAIADRTAAAGHAPIFLHFLKSAGADGASLLPLIRPLARELACRPDWRIEWLDDQRLDPVSDEGPEELFRALATTPRLGIPGSTFIHPTMMQVDSPDIAGKLLPPVITGDPTESANAILRVAALSMLHDDSDHAPYGWTHCLTMPQAILMIAPEIGPPGRALAIAATHVLGFRAALGSVDMPTGALAGPAPASELRTRVSALASAAATSHDAHIAKYTMAVIDAAKSDPEATDLYLAAGERLLGVWEESGGDPSDPLAGLTHT